MIFELRESITTGQLFAVIPADLYGAVDTADTDMFELQTMLENTFPSESFGIACFAAYEDSVNLN